MAEDIFYIQCHLTKGNQTQISWIPKCYAVVGAILKLKDSNGQWDNGWIVKRCSATKLKEYQISGPRDPRPFRNKRNLG